jgi:3-dehydroquinate synthase
MDVKIVDVDLGDRRYPIHIGAGILAALEGRLNYAIKGRRVFIITDSNVMPYAQRVSEAAQSMGAVFTGIYELAPGEQSKSYEALRAVHEWMLGHAINRNALIMAVGGGVIGDLAGFAAATVLRGVPFVQIPTTLLSQVDSSVGGKTGINTPQGKNLVGCFNQPVSVIADIETLKTLPKRQVLAGYAEIVKYGFLGDYNFFEWLETNGRSVVSLDPSSLVQAIETSCRAKARIVQADEREGGVRALLNLGHTFGHALEAAAGFNDTLLHGEAVSIGMVMAFDLSTRMGLCPQADLDRVRRHLSDIGLPIRPQGIKTTVDEMIDSMRRDKKATDSGMTFILVKGIGQAFLTQSVPEDIVRAVVADYL